MFTPLLLSKNEGQRKERIKLVLTEYVEYPSHSHRYLEAKHNITHRQLNGWLSKYLQPHLLRGSCYKRK